MNASAAGNGITTLVLTHNEERHVGACLASIAWADEVVVLDSGSTDATRSIARSHGARVATRPFDNFSRQRQHALGLVHTPFVFFVDADERVSPRLAAEARASVAAGGAAGFWVPRRNLFWGHVMRGGGWWPDYQLRLLRVDASTFDARRAVHEVADVRGPTARLREPLDHLNYDSFGEFRAKQSAYAGLDALRRREEGERVRPHHLLTQPLREFVRRYGKLAGWRDGWLGLQVCAYMAWTELATLRALRRSASAAPP